MLLARNWTEAFDIRAFHRWGELGRKVAATGPVLLHAHFGPDGLIALPLARKLGVPWSRRCAATTLPGRA